MAIKVLIFGATGNVGSKTAANANRNGAEVFLAMRDTTKKIPELEGKGEFERVQADLTKPDTITAAVQKTGATHAFIYLALGSQDGMKSALEALKAGGVGFVVFLSSYDVLDAASTTPADPIGYVHAQVELNLDTVFGSKGFVAIRGGSFAVNTQHWYGQGIKAGEVRILGPKTALDLVTPDDLGDVAGNILVKGPQEQNVVYVCGPELVSQEDVLALLKKKLNKDFKVTEVDKAAITQDLEGQGMPGFVASYLGNLLDKYATGQKPSPHPKWQEGHQNVVKYAGRPGLRYEDWLEQNKHDFLH